MSTVVLPKQVQAQVEEAERIEREMAAPVPGNTDPVEPEVQPAAPVAPAAPEVPTPQSSVDWQRRYEVLQGKFNAEVPVLHQGMREQAAELAQVRQQLEVLRTKPAEQVRQDPLVTNQDDEKFGSDLIDLMRRVARDSLGGLTQKVDAIEKVVRDATQHLQKVQSVPGELAELKLDRFWSDLAVAVPDWQAVNVDERWLAWLAEYDPVAGSTRQAVLDFASREQDHKRVAALFNLFKQQFAAPKPDQRRNELARQVAPSRSARTAATPQGDRVYTGEEYQYWCDPRRLHDKPAKEREEMLAELERALVDGRVKFS